MAGESSFGAVMERALALCQEQKEVPIAELARLAREAGVSPSKLLDELAVAGGCAIDYDKGLVLCSRGEGGASGEDLAELRSALRGMRLELDALTEEVAAIKHLLGQDKK